MRKVGFHRLTDQILASGNDASAKERSKQHQDIYKEMSKYEERICLMFVNVLRARYPEDNDEEITKKMATKKVEDFVVNLVTKKKFDITTGSIAGVYRKWLIGFLTSYETNQIIGEGNYTIEQLEEIFSFIKVKKSPEIISIHTKVREIIHEFYGASPKNVSDGLSKETYSAIKRAVKREIARRQSVLSKEESNYYEI